MKIIFSIIFLIFSFNSLSLAANHESEKDWYAKRLIELKAALYDLDIGAYSCQWEAYDSNVILKTRCAQNYFKHAAININNAIFQYPNLKYTKDYLEQTNIAEEEHKANPNELLPDMNVDTELFTSLKSGPANQIRTVIKAVEDHLKSLE